MFLAFFLQMEATEVQSPPRAEINSQISALVALQPAPTSSELDNVISIFEGTKTRLRSVQSRSNGISSEILTEIVRAALGTISKEIETIFDDLAKIYSTYRFAMALYNSAYPAIKALKAIANQVYIWVCDLYNSACAYITGNTPDGRPKLRAELTSALTNIDAQLAIAKGARKQIYGGRCAVM